MRTATVVLRIDLSDNNLSDLFWKNYFTHWGEACSCPVTVDTSIATVDTIKSDDNIPILLIKRKGKSSLRLELSDPYDPDNPDLLSLVENGWTL